MAISRWGSRLTIWTVSVWRRELGILGSALEYRLTNQLKNFGLVNVGLTWNSTPTIQPPDFHVLMSHIWEQRKIFGDKLTLPSSGSTIEKWLLHSPSRVFGRKSARESQISNLEHLLTFRDTRWLRSFRSQRNYRLQNSRLTQPLVWIPPRYLC